MKYLKKIFEVNNSNDEEVATLVKNMDGVFFSASQYLTTIEINEAWTKNLKYLTKMIKEKPDVAEYFRNILKEVDAQKFGI